MCCAVVSVLLSEVQVSATSPQYRAAQDLGCVEIAGKEFKAGCVKKTREKERAAEDRVGWREGGMDRGEEGLRREGMLRGWAGGVLERTKKMKITHLEQSLLNYSTHILPPLGYVGVELVQIGGER